MEQLLIHILGDYFLQSDWMALEKHRNSWRCFIHCVLYTLPFLLLSQSYQALFLIFATHFLIDRFSLAKYLIWGKNHLNPNFKYADWQYCKVTGYCDALEPQKVPPIPNASVRPLFITIWLYIISDNALHLACNYFILKFV